MTIIPAIDIEGGRCVRLVRGERGTETVYGDDPAGVARTWQAQGAEMLHVVDLDAAFDGQGENRSAIQEIIRAVQTPVQVGGGVRGIADFEWLMEAGAARAVFGTAAVENPSIVKQALAMAPDAVAIGIDVRKDKVSIRGWEQDSALGPVELGKRWVEEGASRFIYTDISRDGVLTGPNIDGVRRFAKETRARVIASGGIGSLEDLLRLGPAREDGVEAVIVGRALYDKVFTLADAIAAGTVSG